MVNEIEDLKRILLTKVLKPLVFKLVWSESKTLMVLTASIKYKVDIISKNNLTGALPSLQFEYGYYRAKEVGRKMRTRKGPSSVP